MKHTFIYLLTTLLTLIATSCTKETLIDKRVLMSAKIGTAFFGVNDAYAIYKETAFLSGKGGLEITGEDATSKITLIIKDYKGVEGSSRLNGSDALAVYVNKSTNLTDTISDGLLNITQVISNYYSIPDLHPSQYRSGQIYKSEIIVGTFEFTTRNNVSAINGVFGISFNK